MDPSDLQPALDARLLLVFRAIGHHGSLSAAARDLGWTQPAVSQQLKRLEREVAQPLVVRTARGVTLTEAGGTLLRHADALAARLRLASDELVALADLRAGTLRLAAFPSACATFVPQALALLLGRHPGLDLRLTEVGPAEARSLLRQGEVDLAVGFSYDDSAEPDDGLVLRRLAVDPVVAVLPRDHPLADHKTVRLNALGKERWIAGCPLCRSHLLARTAAVGFAPDIRHSTDDYVVTQTLVAAGLGVALLPQLALDAAPLHTTTARPLSPPLHRTVFVAHVAGAEALPPAAATLAALRSVTSSGHAAALP